MQIVLGKTRHANLYKEKTSGTYYARLDVGRKIVRRSLKTKDIMKALVKLAAFLEEYSIEKKEILNLSWYAAVEIYLAKQRTRPELKPRALDSIEYFAQRAKKLVDGDVPCESIGEAHCKAWWKQEAMEVSARTANGTLNIVKSVFSMLHKTGSISSDPSADLKKLSIRRKSFNIPSSGDFARIVAEIRNAPILRGHKIKTSSVKKFL